MNTSVYARPIMPRIVVRPALVTLALHGLMLFLLTVSWGPGEREVTRVKPAPKAINARLVDISEFRPKPKPAPPKPPAPRKAAPKPKPAAKPKPAPPKPPPVAKPKPAPKPAARAEPKPAPKPEPRISAAELAALARAELADAVAAEDQARSTEATATADEMAASFAALVQQTVINYWSRPPSARNGMETLLSIQLIPTGEVVNVTILKSSGNTAFDRSAVNAVEKAGSFPELQKLPSREFEKTFRRFRLLFRPEDLRY